MTMLGFVSIFPSKPPRPIIRLHRPVTSCARSGPSPVRAAGFPERVALPPIVFVLGGPGSGKGTQCSKLQRDFDLVQICVGDLLRREATRDTPAGRGVADVMRRGEIVPGEVTMALLKKELASLAGVCMAVLIDGFPRAMDQARAFEDEVAPCDFVLFFQCEREQMVERLLERGKTSGRADDTQEVVRKRLTTFTELTMPVVEHYRERGLLREVDAGVGNAEDVYLRTRRLFEWAFLA